MSFPVSIEQGKVHFRNLKVATEDFELAGSGLIRLNQSGLEFPAVLRIEPALSAAILRSVEELAALTDSEGRLEIPVQVSGNLPQIEVRPDLEYLASRLVMLKAQDLIGDFLQKALGDE